MEHSHLVQEMLFLEQLNAQERLKHAKRRRQEQINQWIMRQNNPLPTPTINRSNQSDPTCEKSRVQFPDLIILLDATTRQDIEEVRRLLQSGQYDPNMANEDGLTPIHQCSIDNSEQLLRLFLEHGGNVNVRDRDLWTPLHAAATCGHMEVCRVLIEQGADLLALNADGNMPYDICEDEFTLDFIETQMDQSGITQDLIDQTRLKPEQQMLNDLENAVQKCSDSSTESTDLLLSFRNTDGATPLHIACAHGYPTVVEFLLDKHVSLNCRDNDGWKPIHAAAFWGQQPVLTQLIQAGADIYDRVPDGRSALELCEDSDLRIYMINVRETCIRNRQKPIAVPVDRRTFPFVEPQKLINTHLSLDNSFLSNSGNNRPSSLYESRSSVSSPYGSGSSLNRSNSVRRTSLHDRKKAKVLNESFLDVLHGSHQIAEDNDETISSTVSSTTPNDLVNSSTVDNNLSFLPTELAAPQVELPSLKVSSTAPAVSSPSTAETLSDVKRRRRDAGGRFASILPRIHSPAVPMKTISAPNIPADSSTKKSTEKIDDAHEKRSCCTIF